MNCLVCGHGMSLGAQIGGFDRHPGCEPLVPTTEWAWRCTRRGCTAGGLAKSASDARTKILEHDPDCLI